MAADGSHVRQITGFSAFRPRYLDWGPAAATQTVRTSMDCKEDGWKSMVDEEGQAFRNQGDCVSYFATGEKNLAQPAN